MWRWPMLALWHRESHCLRAVRIRLARRLQVQGGPRRMRLLTRYCIARALNYCAIVTLTGTHANQLHVASLCLDRLDLPGISAVLFESDKGLPKNVGWIVLQQSLGRWGEHGESRDGLGYRATTMTAAAC